MESFSAIRPDRSEILRYLGYKNQQLDSAFLALLKDCEDTAKRLFQPRFVYGLFPIVHRPDGIELTGTALSLPGEDIRRHLAGCESCILIAATLGGELEREITGCSKTDVTKAAVLDAAATSLIEVFCDEIEQRIRRQEHLEQSCMTTRFSPGYGDLSITLQPMVLEVLSAQKRIGLTCSEDNILMPRKSVTAVIGRSDKINPNRITGCEACNSQSCRYRKAGTGT